MRYLGKVFRFCTTDYSSPDHCIEWAIALLSQGYNSPSLPQLAGLLPPYNSFEVKDYTLKTLEELKIKIPCTNTSTITYAKDIIEDMLEDQTQIESYLHELFRLCIKEDYLDDIYAFYLLHCALDGLKHADYQHYWEGATRNNIEEIIIEESQKWLHEHQNLSV